MPTIQDLCLGYRCREAQLFGAERGACDCPCHSMTDSERESFLALATGGTPADHPARLASGETT